MNWDAYDDLPPEIQDSIDFQLEKIAEFTGEDVPERD